MKVITKLILSLIFVLYPVFIYLGLKDQNLGLFFSIVVVGLFFLRYLLFKNSKSAIGSAFNYAGFVSLCMIIAGIVFKKFDLFKVYPAIVSFSLATVFLLSLTGQNTPVIETIARLKEGELTDTVIRYTRRVTLAWIIFFVLNASVSLYTLFYCELEFWTLYNGLISYILIGLMFSLELLIRRRFKKREARR